MAVNYQPEPSDATTAARNERAIADHFDDDYYIRRLSAGIFVPFATAAHGTCGQSAGLGKWPTIDYPNAASSYAVACFERPRMWISGHLQITVYYTSQTAGTANFSILPVAYTCTLAGNYSNTGITTLLSTSVASPGPAAADDKKSMSIYTTTPLAQSAHQIGIRVGRDGVGDANNNVLQVTEVVVKHIPAMREAHVG